MFILLTLHVRIELKTSEHLFNIKFRNIKHMCFFFKRQNERVHRFGNSFRIFII